jgi:hypothetical protein
MSIANWGAETNPFVLNNDKFDKNWRYVRKITTTRITDFNHLSIQWNKLDDAVKKKKLMWGCE